MRGMAVPILLVLVSSAGSAQQPTCTVPVTVVAPALSDRQKLTLELTTPQTRDLPWVKPFLMDALTRQLDAAPAAVRNLGTDAFVAEEQGRPIPIRSASAVAGPRRILFVVENGKEMPAAARQIEAVVITDILWKARPEDSFALLTARGPRVALGFDASRDAIGAAAQALANTPQSPSNGESARAAVIEATTWLRPPRGGDTIFLLVLRLERMADINFKEVREAVATSGVRVVGFQLGVEDAEGITFVTDDGGLNYTQAFTLGEDSGGGVIEWDTEAGKRDALTSEQLDALKRLGEEAYKRITDEYYLLQVDFIGPKLSISLAPSVLERTPWVSASYPRNLSPCSGTALPGLQPCKIPVRVTAPDLSSLSENEAANVAARWKETLDHTEIEAARSHAPQGTEDLTHASSLQDIASVKTEIVGDLEASAFVARDKLHSVAVRSVSTDEAPRRIVFVVDNGNNLGDSVRDVEAAILSRILLKARPQDSFALLTAHGPRRELPFGSSSAALQSAAEALASPTPGKPAKNGMLDAMLEAAAWLQPPLQGDSIIALGWNVDNGLHASIKKMRRALEAGRIRLFWMQVGGGPGSDQGSKLAALSGGRTSGVWELPRWCSVGPYGPCGHPTGEERKTQLLSDSIEIYLEISQYYLVNLGAFGPHLTINVAPSVQAKYPWAKVHYPQILPPCLNTAAAKDDAPGAPN